MSAQHKGNTQPNIDQEEHEHSLQPATKKVLVYGFDGTSKQIMKVGSNGELMIRTDYEYMGTKGAGGYTYYGFKQRGSASWRIMRMTDADASEVQYAYGTTGWTAAWGSVALQSYDDPPDS